MQHMFGHIKYIRVQRSSDFIRFLTMRVYNKLTTFSFYQWSSSIHVYFPTCSDSSLTLLNCQNIEGTPHIHQSKLSPLLNKDVLKQGLYKLHRKSLSSLSFYERFEVEELQETTPDPLFPGNHEKTQQDEGSWQ